jgi:hypothetical protein
MLQLHGFGVRVSPLPPHRELHGTIGTLREPLGSSTGPLGPSFSRANLAISHHRNNPLKNDDRIKYVATPESTEGTKTRQQEPSSPLSEKRPRDTSNGPEMENSDRKRPRIEDVRNGGEPPERTKGDRMDREDRGDRGERGSQETVNSAPRDNGDRASRERDDDRGRDVARPASRTAAADDQDLEEGEVDD